MFHVREGLFFDRLPDGSVRIEKRADARSDAPTEFEVTIDDWSWASVVASVSLQGETGDRFYRAKDFHNEPPPAMRPGYVAPAVGTTEGEQLT